MPDYPVETKNELCDYLVSIFKLFIGEGMSEWGSDDSDNNYLGNKIVGKNSDDSDD